MKIPEHTISEINHIPPESLEKQGVITAAKTKANGRPTYICPFCGNGSGKSGSGLAVKEYPWGYNYKCFGGSCNGKSYNNLAIFEKYYGETNFVTLCRRICNDFAIYLPSDETLSRRPARKFQQRKTTPKAQKINKVPVAEFEQLDDARNNLHDFIEKQGGKWRGLSLETLQKINCGFLPSVYFPAAEKGLPAIVIPNDLNGVYFRSIQGKFHKNNSPTATTTIFIPDANDFDLIVTEGQINAASIFQAIKDVLNNLPVFGIIASGGTSGNANVLAKLKELKDQGKNFRILIAYDNDSQKQGEKSAIKLLELLRENDFIARIIDITKIPDLDLNDVLQNQGEEKLAQMVNETVVLAQDEIKEESVLNEKISEWTKRNGEINPETLSKVKASAGYLQSFTIDKITATVINESKTIQAFALCRYYDFFQKVADDFFARILTAKDMAKEKLKTATSENPASDADRMTARIEIKAINDAVKKEITKTEKAHLEYQQKQKQQRRKEDWQRRQQQMQDKNNDLLARLKELQKQAPTPARNSEMQEIIAELCEWRMNKYGEKINVKATIKNYDLIFTYDPYIEKLFGYEEFSGNDVFLKSPNWRKCDKFAQWIDSDDSHLRNYLRRTYTEISGDQLYYDVFRGYAQKNSFNVVKDYLENLPAWDGKKRAESLFVDFLKVADNEFTRAVTLKWLLAAVARIYYPGCNFQAALVLQGSQNIGKSYILEKLGGAWYGALIDSVDDTHAVDAIKNLWIVEMKEMAAARKSEINAVKSFIERAADNHRAAYEKRVQTFRRHCVFAISVNDKQFLRDLTGNRRYWILESPLDKFNYIEGLTEEYIQQIWAEIYLKFKELTQGSFNDKILELPKEFKIQAEEIAEKFVVNDGLQKEIEAFLDIKILPPILWNILTKEEKRKFFAKNFIELDEGDWNKRKELLKKADEKREFDKCIDASNEFVRYNKIPRTKDFTETKIAVYGSYTRQETCSVEIYNEFYSSGNDKRKQIFRINEVLGLLKNWKLIEKQRKIFNGYGNQKKIYCRINQDDNIDNDEEKEAPKNDSDSLAQYSPYSTNLDDYDLPF